MASRYRRQFQQARWLRIAALTAVVLAILGALPGFLLIRAAVKDPVFTALQDLRVPSWAALRASTTATGSRWCIRSCRLRAKLADSARPVDQTDLVYRAALRRAGWVQRTGPGCPVPPDGQYSCWQRDQYVLDLWTRQAVCSPAPPSHLDQAPGPGAGSPAPTGPGRTAGAVVAGQSAAPGGGTGVPPGGPSASGTPGTCPSARVSLKVTDRINPYWHK